MDNVILPNTQTTFDWLEANTEGRWIIDNEDMDTVEIAFAQQADAQFAKESLLE